MTGHWIRGEDGIAHLPRHGAPTTARCGLALPVGGGEGCRPVCTVCQQLHRNDLVAEAVEALSASAPITAEQSESLRELGVAVREPDG